MDPVQVMAPPVDIDTDSDNNGTIDQTPYEDSIEAGGSGGSGGYCGNILHWNHDDDNGNGVQDGLEGPGPLQLPGGGPFNDDDLEPAILKVDNLSAYAWASGAAGGSEGYLNGVKLQISHTANLALWRTQNKEPLALTYTFTSGGPPSNVPNEIWVEGLQVGTGSVTWELVAPTEANSGGEVVASDIIHFTVIDIDLDAKTIYHNVASGDLPDDIEDTQGAWVPMNDDDDDYDPQNLPDKNQQGVAIPGEDDLLPMVLRAVQPVSAGGTYRLHVPQNVRVWRNADRTVEVADLATLGATADIPLYVEGMSTGSGTLSVDWLIGQSAVNGADKVTVNVFRWEGPLNVPDYSIHKYWASVAAPGVGNSKWLAPVNGSVDSLVSDQVVWVKWNGGPAVGKAVYQARADYIWDLKVNLVQIQIQSPDGQAAFEQGTPRDFETALDDRGVERKVVKSGDPGVDWAAKVTLNGPNGDRGVKFMRIGFVQNAQVLTHNGTYNTSSATLHSSIEGNSYLDGEEGTTRPYYTVEESSVFFDPDPTANPPRKTRVLYESDEPSLGPPLTFDKGVGVAPGDDVVDSISLALQFHLYVTARTADDRNGAGGIYTSRAVGIWTFNGSGLVGQSPPYEWSAGSGAGVTVPGGWTAVTDGSQPPLLGGEMLTHAIRNDTWGTL